MIVYLLRHGEAEDVGPHGARSDAERRLTAEGRERLLRAAPTWRRLVGDVDRVYSSPLIRARETADVFAEAVRFHGKRGELAGLVPEADPDDVARVILADATEGLTSVAFVGHEPHLGGTLAMLLVGRGSIPFKKGMLVGVELAGKTAPTSRLLCCVTTKLASKLGE